MIHDNGRFNGLISKFIILFLLLGGFALYTYQLDRQSIWRDEALSIGRAHQPISLILQNRNIIQGVDSVDLHPPVYFLLLSGWRQLVGETEFAYRYFSVLAVVLTLALVSALVRRIVPRTERPLASVVVVFLGALSPYYLWYAQEARMYGLVALQMALVLYTLWPCMGARPKINDYAKLFTALIFLTLTHYTGAFVFCFVVGALIVTRLHWRTLVWIGLGGTAVLLFAIPFYNTVIELWGLFDLLRIQPRTLWEMFFEGTVIYHLGAAESLSGNDWKLWLLWAMMGIGAAGLLQANKRPAPYLLLTAGAFLGTFAVFYLSGFIKPNYVNPRHFMVLSIPYLLLLAVGLVWLYGRVRVLGIAGLVAISWIAGSTLYSVVQTPPQTKDDVRQIAAYLEKHGTEGDLVVWYDPSHSITYDYYAVESLPYVAYPPIYLVAGTDIHGEYQQILKDFEAERVWFIDTDNTPIDELAEWMEANWRAQKFKTFPASWTGLYMTLYQQEPQSLPDGDEAATLDLVVDRVTLNAAVLPTSPLAGDGTWVDFYFSTADLLADAPVPDLCLRLKEKSGQEWSATCGPIWIGDSMPADRLFRKQLWLEVPHGLRETEYDLEILWGGNTHTIGAIDIDRTPVADLPSIDFGALAIQETAVLNPELTPSSWLLTDVVWQLVRPWLAEEENLHVSLRLIPRWGGDPVLQKDGLRLGLDAYPVVDWQADDVVRQRLPLQIPATAEFGRYRLQLALQRPDGSYLTTWTTLDEISIVGWELMTGLPDTATPVEPADAPPRFDNNIELIGREIQGESGPITIDLYWRATGEIVSPWTTFIHWGEENAPPISQAGGIPVGNTRPTQTWRNGEVIIDRYVLFVPEGMTFADYALSVGLYNGDTGQRAPLFVDGVAVASGAYRLDTGEK